MRISDRRKDLRLYCNGCKKGFSVTVGTKLHNSRLPLRTWLYAFALVTDAKKGLSALFALAELIEIDEKLILELAYAQYVYEKKAKRKK